MGDRIERPRCLSTAEWGEYLLQAGDILCRSKWTPSRNGGSGYLDELASILAERDRLEAEVKRLSRG